MTSTPTSTTPGDPNADPAKPAATGAPEAYADYKAPEGFTPDPDAVSTANAAFKELGLTQDQAQRLMDIQFAREAKAAKDQAEAVDKMRTQWENDLKADKEIGGKLDTVKTDIGRALATVPAELRSEFQRTMDETGMGNNPAFVKVLFSLAQKVNEGQHVQGGPAPAPSSTSRPTAATAMYPHLAR